MSARSPLDNETVVATIHAEFGKAPKCRYKLGTTEKSPHDHPPRDAPPSISSHSRTEPKIYPNVLHRIGNTPLIRLDNLAKSCGLECDLLAKCEFFNAGGSVKDRIGRRMIEEAEKSGRIKPGDTIIEPTSGNTGIGLAMACAVKGYRCIIVLPEKMSDEKVNVLRALGAEIVRTPTSAGYDSHESHIAQALRLQNDLPNAHILDQYSNPANPLSHYDGTGEEILEACDDQVDMVVAGAGTGGTITGIAAKVKERCPSCEVVGVDPYGSILAQPESLNTLSDEPGKSGSYEVEGIGYDFIPTVLRRELVDSWYKCVDHDSMNMSRRMIREEGLLCGGSSGCAMFAATQLAKKLKKGQKCVVVLPDSTRNYMTKFLSDSWMMEKGFVEAKSDPAVVGQWWYSLKVTQLPPRFPMTLTPTVTCGEAVELLQREGFDQIPVVSPLGEILGVVTESNIMSKMIHGKAKKADTVESVMYKEFRQVDTECTIGTLSRILDKAHFCLVVSKQKCYTGGSAMEERSSIYSIVTRIDLLNFIMAKDSETDPARNN